MERSNYEFDRARFDAVWQRVIPEMAANIPKQPRPDQHTAAKEADTLRDMMADEACDAQFYSTLACMLAVRCSGNTSQMLSRISADERCHLKRLRARYFILTGETYTPPNTCPVIYSVGDALRRKYSGEKEGAAAYRTAAEETADAELRDTYLALSADEARHSKMIGCIIETMF
jgi:rubrerythrin